MKTYDDGGGDATRSRPTIGELATKVFAYLMLVTRTNEPLGPMANRDGVPFIYSLLDEELGQALRYGFAGYSSSRPSRESC